MLTRRRLVKVGAASAVGAGLVPQWLYPDRANAADLRDPNNPGFDLRGVNARYLAQGAPFSPYLLKFAMVNNLTNLWDSNRESQQASFWKVRGHSVGNKKFLPLGDAVSVNGTGPQSVAALLVAPDDQHPDVLRHPIGWQFIIDDHGSHNSRDLRYHQPIPPDGYTALGVCWNSTDADLGNYWCVRDDQVYTLSGRSRVWSDENSHIVHDGSLYRGAFGADDVALGRMLLLPTALIAVDSSIQPAALITSTHAVESVKWIPPGAPPSDPDSHDGDKASPGIARAMVVPCTAISDPTLRNAATVSPFYYVVERPVWSCNKTYSMPEGGHISQSLTIGTQQFASSEFKRATSWTVSSSVGFQAGGVDAHVAVSFTEDFTLTTAQSKTNSTSAEETVNVKLPATPVIQFWQLFSRISVYRGNGSLVSSIDYGKNDYRFVQT